MSENCVNGEVEGLLSTSEDVDGFVLMDQSIVLTGRDDHDGRGVALRITRADAVELLECLSREGVSW